MTGKRECTCKVATHVHGTQTMYVVDRCRCADCRGAAIKAEWQRRRDQLYGRYDTGRVDATPVREHILHLMANGVSCKQTSKVSGIAHSAVSAIVYGRTERGHKPYQRVFARTAAAILAVEPTLDNMADLATVGPTGTLRRLRALGCLGYSQAELCRRLGISAENSTRLFGGNRRVSAKVARKARAIYDELWDKPNTGTDWRSVGVASRARNTARALGWLPPMAWDDDTIDDPDVTPDLGPERVFVKDTIAEDVEFMADTGADRDEIADRLGMAWYSVERSLMRVGRNDLVARVKADPRTNARQARKGRAA